MNAVKKKGEGKKFDLMTFLMDNALYVIIAAIIITITALSPSFLNVGSFVQILMNSSTRVIFALGVGGIIILGGTDLSVGRMVGLTGVIAASLLQSADYAQRVFEFGPLPVIVPILIAMVVSAVFSLLQGFVVAKWSVAPFIASLGFQQIIYGVALVYFNNTCGAAPISNFDQNFVTFTQGTIKITGDLSIPFIIFYAIAVCIIMWFVWNKTTLGKNMYAIGGNREAAKVSGVNVVRTMLIIYVIAGLLYGLGGALEAGRTGTATTGLGISYELDAISACVVGGLSMRGGVGTVPGVALGVFIFQLISSGLIYVGVSPELTYVIKGLIIVIAVALDTRKYIHKSN